MTNKKEAAVLAHCDPKKVERLTARSTTILPCVLRKIKCVCCQIGCMVAAFFALEFFFAPVDPGSMSLSAGWALAAVAGWLALILGRWAGELGGEQG